MSTTKRTIQELRDTAGRAGDIEAVAICDRALAGDADAKRVAIEMWIDGTWKDFDPREFAAESAPGRYLALYPFDTEDDPGSRCGLSDSNIDEVKAALRARGMTLRADDSGLRVVRNEDA